MSAAEPRPFVMCVDPETGCASMDPDEAAAMLRSLSAASACADAAVDALRDATEAHAVELRKAARWWPLVRRAQLIMNTVQASPLVEARLADVAALDVVPEEAAEPEGAE